MNIGFEEQTVGHYIVDIDGCLRATNSRHLSVDEIIALHGRIASDAMLVREINGETVPLARGERVELSDDTVAFFRSVAGTRLFRSARRARFGWGGPAALAA